MIPADWFDLQQAAYKQAGYDFTLPRDQWSEFQARDFAEYVSVANSQGGYDNARNRALGLGVPADTVDAVLAKAAILPPQPAPAPPPPSPPPPPVRPPHVEPPAPWWRRLFGRRGG